MTVKKNLKSFPVHLGLGASAMAEPEFTGSMQWYMDYASRHQGDGAEGRLVAWHEFTENWGTWEMHPEGHELVICVSGTMALVQEVDAGKQESVTLRAGEYAINPPGVWHTANASKRVIALFVTAGKGTQNRPRS